MSSHHSSSAKVPLTIHHAAPLRRTGNSAFRSFVRTPAQMSRALSSSGAAGASPQRNPLSYDPSVGNILNELQKLQMDSDAMSVPSAGAAAPTPADQAAITTAATLPPLSLDPDASPSADADDSHDGPDRSQKPLHRCTLDLLQLFRVCNPAYSWTGQLQPRRVLTSPSVPSATNPHDNVNANLIMSVGDLLWHNTEDSHVFRDKVPPPPKPRADSTAPPQRYERSFKVLELLGEGTFGQVVKCEEVLTLVNASTNIMHQAPNVSSSTGNKKPKVYRAIKVIKNKAAYYNQALMEIQIVRLLNEKYDPENRHHLLRMISSFNYRGHLCLVFELLSVNLYELMKQNGYRGLSWSLLRMFLKQLLDSLQVLTEAKIIHCDLKPENILLNKLTAPDITLIDFGSACFEYQTVYSYIQSRFYRSPEVLLGLTYNSTIDLWSFGCIAAELYLGLPLFPGITQHNQLQRIIKFIGFPPTSMLERGKNTKKFFKNPSSGSYVLKTAEEYAADTHTEVGVHKTYFKGSYLKEVIDLYPMRKGLNDTQKAQEIEDRKSFLHFLQGFLRWDATQRWTPKQALHHPFLQRQPLSTLDEAAFEKLRYVVDQPASIPSAMPAAGGAGSAASSPTTKPAPLSSVAATAASSVASPSSAAAATAPGPSSQLPNTAAVVSPSKGATAPGIGSGVSSAATAVSGQLLSNSELALRHSQQQQPQQPPNARGSGSFSQAAPLTFLPQQQQPLQPLQGVPLSNTFGVPQQQQPAQLSQQHLAFLQQQQQQQQFALQQQQQQQQLMQQHSPQYGAMSLPQTIRQQPLHNSPQRGPAVPGTAAYSPQQLQLILQQQQAALILQQQQQQLAYAQQGAGSAHLPAGAYQSQQPAQSQQQQQSPPGSRPW